MTNLRANIRQNATGLLDGSVGWVKPLIAQDPPSTRDVDLALMALRELTHKGCEQARQERGHSWKTWVREATPGKLYQHTKGDPWKGPATMLKKPDGGFTADPAEMDKLLRDAWDTIFRMYAHIPEPEWEPFWDRFGQYIKHVQMDVVDMTASDLRRTMGRQKSKSAAGLDGWRVAELKSLPTFYLERLAELYNTIETTGTWPKALTRARISLIQKGEGAEPPQQRPISVASAVYRLWAATRLRVAMEWQEGWIHEGQHGFRAKHSTVDVYWEVALLLEQAVLDGEDLSGLILDYAKCFDKLPHKIMLKLAEEAGAHARLLGPLKDMYDRIRRRFKMAGGLGTEFIATNGILQGCPWSVILLNLLVSIWAQAVEAETGAKARAYADDNTVLGRRSETEKGGAISMEFCDLTGQELGVPKCYGFSLQRTETAPRQPPLSMGGQVVKDVQATRLLGADMRFCPGKVPVEANKAYRGTSEACGSNCSKDWSTANQVRQEGAHAADATRRFSLLRSGGHGFQRPAAARAGGGCLESNLG